MSDICTPRNGRCPLGLSGKCWQPVNKAELERDGRQATLEGF